ncbi:MAG: CPBP family glutamic-type intramembrane protease [Planctomycetes bacterium]|nr:CPBP family glutamic-type intramembrane protease [Planctomycetota bacterium]
MSGSRPSTTTGLRTWLVLTFALTWGAVWAFREPWLGEDRPLGSRLLSASLFYAVAMGWQPLFAAWWVRTRVEPMDARSAGLRPSGRRFLRLARSTPFAVAAGAILVALSLDLAGLPAGPAPGPAATPSPAPAPAAALTLVPAFLAALALLWIQALSEEIGWRGYFLTRLVERIGLLPGLLLHGVLWGAWYAPVFLLSGGGAARSLERGGAFVLTCCLLGALLGWMRIASRSVVPSTVANAALTVAAGLPLLLQGADPGVRGAAWGPPGWVPLAMGAGILFLGPWRRILEGSSRRITARLRAGAG